jgi:hypothetical protein
MTVWRESPPPGLIAAAEQDYHAAREELDQMIAAVRTVLAGDFSEIEAVTDIWRSLRVQQHKPLVLLVSAAAIMRLATQSASTEAEHGPWITGHTSPCPPVTPHSRESDQ